MRMFFTVFALVAAAVLTTGAQARRMPGSRVSTESQCAADLGTGVKSKRRFCDVIVTSVAAESVTIPVPAHTGAATLLFDLHNRFSVPVVAGQPLLAFQRHEAVVSVIRPNGDVIRKAAAIREFRATTDLFDVIAGGGRPGGVKAIAPGPAESISVQIPAGVASVGIAGVRLSVRTSASGPEVFDTPGRPVAIASNMRVEYRPR